MIETNDPVHQIQFYIYAIWNYFCFCAVYLFIKWQMKNMYSNKVISVQSIESLWLHTVILGRHYFWSLSFVIDYVLYCDRNGIYFVFNAICLVTTSSYYIPSSSVFNFIVGGCKFNGNSPIKFILVLQYVNTWYYVRTSCPLDRPYPIQCLQINLSHCQPKRKIYLRKYISATARVSYSGR